MSNGTTGLIWSLAELLRGSWKQYEYQDVILPFTVLRRLDCVLEKTKPKVLEQYNKLQGKVDPDPILRKATKFAFYNTSEYDFQKLLADPAHINKNLRHYLKGFSPNIQDIFEKFDFEKHLSRLQGGNLLYEIIKRFSQIDLHPDVIPNHDMGYVFEELLRRFAELSNETAGEHYTPREVIQMMVEILFSTEKKALQKQHLVKTVYDPCCGTGGMLTVSKDHIYGTSFDYILANPPFGVDWKKDMEAVHREAAHGSSGRFAAGTPRISDGQLLFLQHMISKMHDPKEGGSRIAIVMNGSPLFTGDAGSGESEIRRWLLENDWLEAIVALP